MEKKHQDIRNHKRVLNSLTGYQEKKLLIWLAERMPSWVTSDLLTIIGFLGAVVIFTSYALTNIDSSFLWLASFGFFLNWFGDSLDGTIARVRKTERPIYGFYVDHVVDAFTEILIFLGIGVSPYMHFEISCLALIGYMLLSVLVYVRTAVSGEFKISYGKLGPTEARIIAVLANTLVFFIGNPHLSIGSIMLSVYDWIGIIITAILLIMSISTTFHQLSILRDVDQVDLRQKSDI